MADDQMLLHYVFHMDACFIPFTSNGILSVKKFCLGLSFYYFLSAKIEINVNFKGKDRFLVRA